MFIWATLAGHAKYAKLLRVLCVFFVIQSLLSLPVGIAMVRQPPYQFYPLIHGRPDFNYFDQSQLPITVIPDDIGFIENIIVHENFVLVNENHLVVAVNSYEDWEERYEHTADSVIIITPDYFFYRDPDSLLHLPINLVPAWVLENRDYRELFNHLALFNQYFGGLVAPVFLLVFIVFVLMQSLIFVAAIWLFGYWQKLSGNMTVKERFSVCTFASIPAMLISVVFGMFFPVIHVMVFQFLMIYFSYKALKEYFNA